MNNIYVLDQNFELQGVIDEYVSIIWRPAYYDIGDFEIYLGATDKAISLLRENWYVVRSSDISVENGVTTYKKVMVIKNLQLITDVENGDFYCVTGRELKFLLHQRIIWGRYIISDSVEYCLRRLIGANAIDPVEPTRTIPNMQHAEPKGYPEQIELQISNKQLDEAVIEICKTYGYGWDIYITDNKLTVDIYKGVNRSYGQTENPYVVFGDNFENLFTTEYLYESENYANMTLVGGEGEGLDRIYAYVNNELSGLERYETFTDARDISQNLDSEEEAISYEGYLRLLEERGKEELAGKVISEGFTGEVLSDVAFKYGADFFIGDVVTVINKYGIQKNVRVLSAIESEGEDGVKLLPQFSM